MSLYLASINSGSNGNCYYIGNEKDAVLVDAGISCRETERRMARMGLSLRKVRAIFISHEHTDHTRGVEVISRKHRIPVYITEKTKLYSRLSFDPGLIHHFSSDEIIRIGDLAVHPFVKRHDAVDPHSFTVHGNGVTAGVFTDIGSACEHLLRHLGMCHAAFLESNYDEGMLDRGPYPLYLKRRIRSDVGHLSNHQALELFLNHRSPHLSLMLLSHLSAENNHPKLVHDLFTHHANGTKVAVASRYEETGVFVVG
jgi:phosphoribosyl 1,2-cyclic phosphodiesterase